MKFRSLLLTLALTLVTVPSVADKAAKLSGNTFQTFSGAAQVADTSFTLFTDKSGIHVTSTVVYPDKGTGTSINNYKVGPDGAIAAADMVNNANAMHIIYIPDRADSQLEINMLRSGKPIGGRKIPMKAPADFVVAFDDDPSVFQVMLAVTAAHPHTNGVYQLFIPGKSAAQPDRMEPYLLKKATDEPKGKLNDTEIPLVHYTLQFNSGTGDIYTDKDGNLMLADVTPLKARHVRSGFTLSK